jgi:hypothetical protein
MTTDTKVVTDLAHMAVMAEEMEAYLRSDVLFWPLGGRPMLTLGGYLMRQHRLLALADSLDLEQQATLNTAVSQFMAATHDKIVRFETKASREIEARIRQWSEHLRDVDKAKKDSSLYKSGIETRIMLTLLLERLEHSPYKEKPELAKRLEMIDMGVWVRWKKGAFVLDEVLEPVYDPKIFWYLFGKLH